MPPLDPDVLRNLALLLPVLAVALAAYVRHRRPSTRGDLRIPAAALASTVAFVGLLAVDAVAQRAQWWSFAEAPAHLGAMPAEVAVGWALAWGALPTLAGGHWSLWLAGFAWVDILLMPALEPMLVLHDGWLWGEALLLAASALPALLVTRLGAAGRTAVQAVTFVALVCWLVPDVVLRVEGLSWADVVDHPYAVRALLLAAVVVFGTPGVVAAVELARAGGTPWPWDPPERLATVGPYAYVANPMQVSMVAMLALLALAAGSWWVGATALIAFAFSAGVAEMHEREHMDRRWEGYAPWRSAVRAWVPRWRPYVAAHSTLWVAETCEVCTTTGDALEALGPVGVRRAAAEDAPRALTRIEWEGGGTTDRGVAAVARTLEQVNLAAAWFGWFLRLPVVNLVVQGVADACGLGPRDIPRRSDASRTVSP